MVDTSADVRRWTSCRRLPRITEILAGKGAIADAERQHGLAPAEVNDWNA